MANDPISKWANEAQKKETQEYNLTANKLNVSAEDVEISDLHSKIEILCKDLERIRNYNLDLKLQILEEKEKIQKILSIINK